MGDRLWAGQPSRYVTGHIGRLSLPFSPPTSAVGKSSTGLCRVSTNLIKQISRRFPGDSRTCLPYFGLLCNVPHLLLFNGACGDELQTNVWHAFYTTWGRGKDKISFLNKWSGTQFYDWKPMRSIFDILYKNFQEDQLNSRRFPGAFLNSSRFPGVIDTLLWLWLRRESGGK